VLLQRGGAGKNEEIYLPSQKFKQMADNFATALNIEITI
jgi:hypothetical protein